MIVLDTHCWVWWVSGGNQLSAPALEAIEEGLGKSVLYVSSISVWEVALLARSGRLELTMPVEDWVAKSEALPFLHFAPVDNRIALLSNQLPPPLHRDPADRIIVATCLTLGARLVTRDDKLLRYGHVESVW